MKNLFSYFTLLKLSSMENYWKYKFKFNQFILRIINVRYKLVGKTDKAKKDNKISLKFWSWSIGFILKGLLFVVVILCLEAFVKDIISNYSQLNRTTNEIYNILKYFSISDKEYYIVLNILTLISSIIGLILGLFFPILTSVANSTYSKVSVDISNLLTNEPYTQRFLRLLSFLLSVSIITIFSILLGYKPNIILLGIIVLLSLRSIFVLVKLGLGIFNYYKPSTLIDTIIIEMFDIIIKVINQKHILYRKNITNPFRQKILKNIDQLKIILSFLSTEKNIQKESLSHVIEQVFLFLHNYELIKYKIPQENNWFSQRAEYISPFLYNDTKREMFVKFYNIPEPKKIPYVNWLEDELLESISDMMLNFNNHNNLQSVIIILEYFSRYGETLGGNGDIEILKSILNINDNFINEIFNDKYKENFIGKLNTSAIRNNVSLLETALLAYQNFGFGVYKKINKYQLEYFKNVINKIKWEKIDSVFNFNILSKSQKTLIELKSQLDNEKKVKGYYETPIWFIQQTLATDFIINFNNIIKEYVDLFDDIFIHKCQYYKNKKIYYQLAFILHFGLRVLWEFDRHIGTYKIIFGEFESIRKNEAGTWMSIEFEYIENKLSKNKEILINEISENIVPLSFMRYNVDLPDLFGQSYEILTREITVAFEKNDFDNFDKLFKPLFISCLNGKNYIINHLNNKRYDNYYINTITMQFIIDLLQISGLALIYSELYPDLKYKESCINLWNNILNDASKVGFKNEKHMIEWIIANYTFYSQIDVKYSSIVYFRNNEREKTLKSAFNKLGIKKEIDYGFHIKENLGNDILKENALIYLLCPREHEFEVNEYDFAEVFLELYILCRIEAMDVEVNFNRDFLNDLLEQYNIRRNNESRLKE